MPFKSQRAKLVLTKKEIAELTAISRSRTQSAARVERAQILIAYNKGEPINRIARQIMTNRPKVERSVDRALQLGAIPSLDDLPREGRPSTITSQARTWLISLACQKPKDLGYSYELWTTRLLAKHIKKNCLRAKHPCLSKISPGTVSKILSKNEIRPHKISYYLERRDPDFDQKMAQVLCVYKEVEMLNKSPEDHSSKIAVLSYDEKPGIQAIQAKAPDLPPVPGRYPNISRDYEYIRHGTISLLAGIDLLSGHVHGIVRDRHRSREFVEFLKMVDASYPPDIKIRIILDNHRAHTSKETRKYLGDVPNRFEFIFTPTHGSWLNLVESFFSKMTRTMLRGIRVKSKQELCERILKFLDEVNDSPVVFKWKWGLDAISIA